VRDSEIDQVLKAAHIPDGPKPETLRRVLGSIEASIKPVHPLPPRWVLSLGLVVLAAAFALAAAARAGFFGIERMHPWERVLIFSVLGVFVAASAKQFVNTMIPGSRYRISAGGLLGVGTIAILSVFALSFRDYRIDNFVSAGVACLIAGIEHAVPAALLGWLLLRRGLAVNLMAAGLAAGTLGGLVGLAVLELHCPNFEAAHVLVWHTAVVPLSAGLGALFAWMLRLLRRSSR
jgi:hypothetical protein